MMQGDEASNTRSGSCEPVPKVGKAGLQGLSSCPRRGWHSGTPPASQRRGPARGTEASPEPLPQHLPVLAAGRAHGSHGSEPAGCPSNTQPVVKVPGPAAVRPGIQTPASPWPVLEAPERRQRLPAETCGRCQGTREECLPAQTEAEGSKRTRLLQRPAWHPPGRDSRHVLYSGPPNPTPGTKPHSPVP